MADKTERDLMLRLSHGEAVAYEQLFERYFYKIRRFVTAIIHDEVPAEDIAQNVFMKVWVNRTAIMQVNSLNNYLFTISRNEALDYLRRQANRDKFVSSVKTDTLQEAYRITLNYDLDRIERIVEKCVEQMPSQRKIVYRMSREDKLTNTEIAERLQLSKRTVDRHISLALKDIRAALGSIVSGLAVFFLSNWV